MIFRCDGGCEAMFDCEGDEEHDHTEGGGCSLLVRAGWKPVWVRVLMELHGLRGDDEHLLSRGGWVCPACIKRFAR